MQAWEKADAVPPEADMWNIQPPLVFSSGPVGVEK